LETEVLEKYKKAGKIAKKVSESAREWIKPGAKLIDVALKVEDLIAKEGAGNAFPVNLSLNEVAAHFTPELDCVDVIKKEDLVTFDVGVHVDGYIADTAFTVSMNKDPEQEKLIKAAENALKAAIETVKPGINVSKVGEAVEKEITELGFKPIENLTGHGLDEYSLHAGLTIPNVKREGQTLQEGQAIAIEPFSTNGTGSVSDSKEIYIYEFLMNKPSRIREARRILQMGEKEFHGLPFAKRWLEKKIGKLKMNMALRDLVNMNALYQYPVLKEKEKGLVAQAEHTLIVQDEPIVTTR
jgi:methionyl aminopeptidase